MSSLLEAWIRARRPPVPGPFAAWMRPSGEASGDVASDLVVEARVALRRARGADDRPHRGAFDLLAADGFVTWACEAALEGEAPVAGLSTILASVAE